MIHSAPRIMTGSTLLGRLLGANMNSTSDQAIPISHANYVVDRIVVTNASASLTLSAGGIYTATSKGGSAVVGAAQVYSALTAAIKFLDLTLSAGATDRLTSLTLYLSLTTGQGSAATADIYVYGMPIP